MAKYIPTSATNPRFMQPQEFEDEAALLLAEYGNAEGKVSAPPVPIDDMVAFLKVEGARREGVEVSLGEYCRVGVPITVLTLLAGVAWLQWVRY